MRWARTHSHRSSETFDARAVGRSLGSVRPSPRRIAIPRRVRSATAALKSCIRGFIDELRIEFENLDATGGVVPRGGRGEEVHIIQTADIDPSIGMGPGDGIFWAEQHHGRSLGCETHVDVGQRQKQQPPSDQKCHHMFQLVASSGASEYSSGSPSSRVAVKSGVNFVVV